MDNHRKTPGYLGVTERGDQATIVRLIDGRVCSRRASVVVAERS
jgi:hypothetical protein